MSEHPSFVQAFVGTAHGPPAKLRHPSLFRFEAQILKLGTSRCLPLRSSKRAAVAQLAEQLFCKQQVTGSIPVGGSGAPWRRQDSPHLPGGLNRSPHHRLTAILSEPG